MNTNNDSQFVYDVVVSFAGEDRAAVQKFVRLLDTKKITYFYDEDKAHELWGKDLTTDLADVYEQQARYCLMFISEHYLRKKWTNFERLHIQARAFRDPNEYILPIRLDDTVIPGIPETIGFRDLRQHDIENIVDTLERKLATAKGRATKSRTSPKTRSANRQSISSPSEIPMPRRDKTFTELQKDRFAKESFDFIRKYFQRALKELETHDPEIQTDLTKINNLEFTCKIYVKEAVKRQCRIWLGERNTIYYHEGVSMFGQGNAYNDFLTVEDNKEELRLRTSGMGIGIQVGESLVTKEKGAEYLWKRLTSYL